MKVILIENVDNLGQKGEVKEVADGYARNFLFPKKLAILATSQALRELKEKKEREERKKEKLRKEAEILKKRIQGLEIIIKSKANEEGNLFGSIDEKAISQVLKKKGYNLESEKIILEEHFKKIGEYRVVLNLFEGVQAEIKVKIEKE